MSADIRQRLRQAAASGSADAMLRAGAAALQDGTGTDADAVEPVREVLRRHPRNPHLWHLLGLLCRNLDSLASGVEAFSKAAELAPRDPMVAHAHACVRYEAGLPAARLFERAMALAPADRSIRLRHAAALIAEGREEEAMAGIEEALGKTPLWLEGQTALARLRWTRGDREDFAQGFERAVAAAPRDFAVWAAYLSTLLHDGLFDRALLVIARARAAAGAHSAFDGAEAVARTELGELDAAAALYRCPALGAGAADVVPYLRFLLRSGRVEEAAQLGARRAPSDRGGRIWPYLAVAWRLLDDPRWEWLEGDPSFIGVYDLSASLPPLPALAERLRALHRNLHQPLDQSLRGGTQTEGHLFARIEPEIVALRRAVVEAVESHVARLPPPRPGHPLLLERRSPIRFSGSWSVRLTGGGRHVGHVHMSGWLSSALYVALPAEEERGEGEAGWLALGDAGALGVELAPIRQVEPKPGRLVLFPSTMWHGTRPFAAGERLTVAFDVRRPG